MDAIVILVLLVVSLVSGDSRNECDNEQFVELGKSATLHCIFESGFVGVFWYNSTNIDDDTPLVFFQRHNSEKSGKGYDSGEFNVHQNGSLIIANVTVTHETVFTVSQLINLQGLEKLHYIDVKTYVEPEQQFPVIQECYEKQHCYLSNDKVSSLKCCVNNSRPSVELRWTDRLSEYESNITTFQNEGSNGITFSSCVMTNYPSTQSHRLSLLACTAEDPFALLRKDRSFVLVENENIGMGQETNKSTLYLELDSTINLTCSESQSGLFLWRTSQNMRILAYGSTHEGLTFSRWFRKFFEVGSNGNLYIRRIRPQHDGVYFCYYREIENEGAFVYNITTYVKPKPAYPLVEGCDQQYCVLPIERQDQLRCTLLGIRPITHLEFVSMTEMQQHVILNQNHEVTNRGDIFDISVTVTLKITSPSEPGQLTLVCRTTGPNSDRWKFETVVDLRYPYGNHTMAKTEDFKDPVDYRTFLVIILCFIVGAAFVILLAFIVRLVFKIVLPDPPIPPIPPIPTPPTPITDPEGVFIDCLQASYRRMCVKVYPVPYMKGKPYKVEDVFVENGIEQLARDQSTQPTLSQNVRLNSYQEMFDMNVVNASRIILMADPGHGKSTLFLRAALDWSNKNQSPPWKDIKVLVLLQLRKITKADTICAAIRRQLVATNLRNRFSNNDIMDILNTHRVRSVIILDGFDNYCDRMVHSEIIELINGNMFPEVKVIIATRPSCIPRGLDAEVVKLRLTGFDEFAHNQYIDKVIQCNEVKAKLRTLIKMNPILEDLYRIPLVCVMFIHMLQKETSDIARFYSVTNLFQRMLSGLFYHKWNKDSRSRNLNSTEIKFPQYPALYEFCFRALCGRTSKWTYEDMLPKIGNDCYKELTDIGILMEENKINYNVDDPLQCVTEIRFFHRVFIEWYAANHVEKLGNRGFKQRFQNHNLVQYQLFLRFCCGLSPQNAGIIKGCIAEEDERHFFQMFCDLEQSDKPEEFLTKVEDVCCGMMVLASSDTQLYQRSALQLLEIASNNTDVPLKVRLENNFKGVDQITGGILLKSDLRLTLLKNLKSLQIDGDKSSIETNDFLGILEYCSNCNSFEELTFSDCIVPKFIEVSKLQQMKQMSVKWQTFFTLSLELESGKWKDIRTTKELRESDHENWVLYTRQQLTEEELKRQCNADEDEITF